MHDLDERRVSAPLPHRDRRPYDRAHLHLVDLREEEPEPAGAPAEHRIRLLQRPDPLAHALVLLLVERGQELVQRPVEQADRHRQPGHRLEDPLEVGLLDRQQPLERRASAVLVAGEDHLPHQPQPLRLGEHVLGPAEADPLGAELARLGRVLGRVGVRAHTQSADPVRPLEDRGEVVVDLRRHERHRADDHLAGAAVDRDRVAVLQLVAGKAGRLGAHVDVERLAAGDAWRPHPARDDGGMRGEPAVGGQDPGRLDHPVEVVRGRLPADEDDALPRLAALLGGVGVEDDRAGGGAG